MPSTRIIGFELLNVPTPLMRMVAPSEPGFEEAWFMYRPGIEYRASEACDIGRFSISAMSLTVMDPVNVSFFCEPYPMTTDSSRSLVSSRRVMWNGCCSCPVRITVLEMNPR